jgi:hypothetical protein
VDRDKALDKGKTGVNKQRPGLPSTSIKDGRVSRENALITAGRQEHFADWKRATARHVAGKCAQHCPQPSGVEMCVCVFACVRARAHLHVSPMKESSVCSRLNSYRERT